MLRLRSYLVALAQKERDAQVMVELTQTLADVQASAQANKVTGTPTVTLKQQGDSITGHYSSQTLGEADLKGTVKDRKINFSFRVDILNLFNDPLFNGPVSTFGTSTEPDAPLNCTLMSG